MSASRIREQQKELKAKLAVRLEDKFIAELATSKLGAPSKADTYFERAALEWVTKLTLRETAIKKNKLASIGQEGEWEQLVKLALKIIPIQIACENKTQKKDIKTQKTDIQKLIAQEIQDYLKEYWRGEEKQTPAKFIKLLDKKVKSDADLADFIESITYEPIKGITDEADDQESDDELSSDEEEEEEEKEEKKIAHQPNETISSKTKEKIDAIDFLIETYNQAKNPKHAFSKAPFQEIAKHLEKNLGNTSNASTYADLLYATLCQEAIREGSFKGNTDELEKVLKKLQGTQRTVLDKIAGEINALPGDFNKLKDSMTGVIGSVKKAQEEQVLLNGARKSFTAYKNAIQKIKVVGAPLGIVLDDLGEQGKEAIEHRKQVSSELSVIINNPQLYEMSTYTEAMELRNELDSFEREHTIVIQPITPISGHTTTIETTSFGEDKRNIDSEQSTSTRSIVTESDEDLNEDDFEIEEGLDTATTTFNTDYLYGDGDGKTDLGISELLEKARSSKETSNALIEEAKSLEKAASSLPVKDNQFEMLIDSSNLLIQAISKALEARNEMKNEKNIYKEMKKIDKKHPELKELKENLKDRMEKCDQFIEETSNLLGGQVNYAKEGVDNAYSTANDNLSSLTETINEMAADDNTEITDYEGPLDELSSTAKDLKEVINSYRILLSNSTLPNALLSTIETAEAESEAAYDKALILMTRIHAERFKISANEFMENGISTLNQMEIELKYTSEDDIKRISKPFFEETIGFYSKARENFIEEKENREDMMSRTNDSSLLGDRTISDITADLYNIDKAVSDIQERIRKIDGEFKEELGDLSGHELEDKSDIDFLLGSMANNPKPLTMTLGIDALLEEAEKSKNLSNQLIAEAERLSLEAIQAAGKGDKFDDLNTSSNLLMQAAQEASRAKEELAKEQKLYDSVEKLDPGYSELKKLRKDLKIRMKNCDEIIKNANDLRAINIIHVKKIIGIDSASKDNNISKIKETLDKDLESFKDDLSKIIIYMNDIIDRGDSNASTEYNQALESLRKITDSLNTISEQYTILYNHAVMPPEHASKNDLLNSVTESQDLHQQALNLINLRAPADLLRIDANACFAQRESLSEREEATPKLAEAILLCQEQIQSLNEAIMHLENEHHIRANAELMLKSNPNLLGNRHLKHILVDIDVAKELKAEVEQRLSTLTLFEEAENKIQSSDNLLNDAKQQADKAPYGDEIENLIDAAEELIPAEKLAKQAYDELFIAVTNCNILANDPNNNSRVTALKRKLDPRVSDLNEFIDGVVQRKNYCINKAKEILSNNIYKTSHNLSELDKIIKNSEVDEISAVENRLTVLSLKEMRDDLNKNKESCEKLLDLTDELSAPHAEIRRLLHNNEIARQEASDLENIYFEKLQTHADMHHEEAKEHHKDAKKEAESADKAEKKSPLPDWREANNHYQSQIDLLDQAIVKLKLELHVREMMEEVLPPMKGERTVADVESDIIEREKEKAKAETALKGVKSLVPPIVGHEPSDDYSQLLHPEKVMQNAQRKIDYFNKSKNENAVSKKKNVDKRPAQVHEISEIIESNLYALTWAAKDGKTISHTEKSQAAKDNLNKVKKNYQRLKTQIEEQQGILQIYVNQLKTIESFYASSEFKGKNQKYLLGNALNEMKKKHTQIEDSIRSENAKAVPDQNVIKGLEKQRQQLSKNITELTTTISQPPAAIALAASVYSALNPGILSGSDRKLVTVRENAEYMYTEFSKLNGKLAELDTEIRKAESAMTVAKTKPEEVEILSYAHEAEVVSFDPAIEPIDKAAKRITEEKLNAALKKAGLSVAPKGSVGIDAIKSKAFKGAIDDTHIRWNEMTISEKGKTTVFGWTECYDKSSGRVVAEMNVAGDLNPAWALANSLRAKHPKDYAKYFPHDYPVPTEISTRDKKLDAFFESYIEYAVRLKQPIGDQSLTDFLQYQKVSNVDCQNLSSMLVSVPARAKEIISGYESRTTQQYGLGTKHTFPSNEYLLMALARLGNQLATNGTKSFSSSGIVGSGYPHAMMLWTTLLGLQDSHPRMYSNASTITAPVKEITDSAMRDFKRLVNNRPELLNSLSAMIGSIPKSELKDSLQTFVKMREIDVHTEMAARNIENSSPFGRGR